MDDLDELLSGKQPPPERPGLQVAIDRDANRVQRRRRWLIRGRRVVVLAACYAAGLWSMCYSAPPHQPEHPEIVERMPAPKEVAPTTVADPYRNDPPERIEKWAFLQAGEKRVELYRRAGDGYLVREDLQGALRCYRRALDGGTIADLAIRAESDSWLLMSLKLARKKEKADAGVN
jgi:hypothetical protein